MGTLRADPLGAFGPISWQYRQNENSSVGLRNTWRSG